MFDYSVGVVQEFFRSVAEAFARGRSVVPAVEAGILALIAAGLLLQLAGMGRGWWRRRTHLRQLAARHGIEDADLAFAAGLARIERVAPIALLTRVDLFERATARALAREGTRREAAERVHRLRRALGFDRLPAHAPLLTSRELAPGTAVELGPHCAEACAVDELALSIRLPNAAIAAAGADVTLTLAHAREARYELRCRVLDLRDGPDGRELVLSHDEAPRRIQLREHVRVATRSAVALHPVPPWPVHGEAPADEVVRLEDVSGGGARVVSRALLPVGLLAEATFAIGPARFEKLPAVVVASEPRRDGSCEARLEWGRLAEAERSRLVAAVSRLQLMELGGRAQG